MGSGKIKPKDEEDQGGHKLWNDIVRFMELQRKKQYYGFGRYVGDCGDSKKFVDQAISQIYRHFDVLFVFNKIIEIDKLKKLLLTEDQEKVFNFISRPTIKYV